MSIENDLERIANALEDLLGHIMKKDSLATADKLKEAVDAKMSSASKTVPPAPSKSKADASPVATSTATTPSTPTAPPAPPVAEPTAPAVAPSTSDIKCTSADECNGLLVKEYNRLGATPEAMQRILGVMDELAGVRSVNDLTKEQYVPLITNIRELS